MLTINQLLKKSRKKSKSFSRKAALNRNPQKKGICQKIYTTTPKKPNSAIRKIAKVKLSNNKTIIAYIPGESHFLQEHNFVLIKGGRVRDLPGVNYKIIRGNRDAIAVLTRKTSRSKYGTKNPKNLSKIKL